MNIKIQSKGIAGGDNTGSCRKYARYLAHENEWKEKNGLILDKIPMYDRNKAVVSESTVIDSIDHNKSHLHATEAKYFSCIISFSEEEVNSMGEDRAERISSAHKMTELIMDRYAQGFGSDKVKDHNDLLYFYTIHEFREKENGNLVPGLHVHVIVSRKDACNRYKLSPMTTYKEGSSGVIKRGFCRDEFVSDCEAVFDRTFSHKRKVEDSYEYCRALIHGTREEKEFQIERAVKEKHIAEQISAALLERMTRLVREAASNIRQVEDNTEKARRDRFWNDYFSYYKPRITDLRKTCGLAFNLYRDAQEKYNIQSKDISEKYSRLKELYERMDKLENTITKTKTIPALLLTIAGLIATADAMPAVLLGLVTAIIVAPIAKFTRDVTIDIKRDLRRQAADIREDIVELRDRREKLKELKNNSLKDYLKVKEEKTDIQKQIDELKKELEKPLEKRDTVIDLAKRYQVYKQTQGQSKEKTTVTGDPFGLLYRALFLSKDRADLEIKCQEYGISISEVIHPNGGVANLTIVKGEASMTIEQTERFKEIIDRWELMTGHIPAYKVQAPKVNRENQQIQIRRKGPKL